MLETKRRRRSESQQRLAPNSQYAKPKSKPAREAFLFAAFPASPLPLLHYSRCHSENGRPGSHKYGSAALAEMPPDKIYKRASSHAQLASILPPPRRCPFPTLFSASSPAGLCCCSKVKVCLKAVNNLTTKYESVKWPEEGEGALEGCRDMGW